MVFTELNDGRTENIMQMSYIDIQGKDVLYYPAKGSLTEVREHFDTEEDAKARYEELNKKLIKT